MSGWKPIDEYREGDLAVFCVVNQDRFNDYVLGDFQSDRELYPGIITNRFGRTTFIYFHDVDWFMPIDEPPPGRDRSRVKTAHPI